MIRMYSKRLLTPFVGVVQIAECEQARAVSLDGTHWATQHALSAQASPRMRRAYINPSLHYSLVATIDHDTLRLHALHPLLDPTHVKATIQALYQTVRAARVPFPTADGFECWLLDADQQRPLALLQSCTDEREIPLASLTAGWIAVPAAQLDVPSP